MSENVAIDKNMKGPRSSSVGGGGTTSSSTKNNSNRPKDNKFTQQELPAWKPILTPNLVLSSFVLVGIIFIPIGLASLLASNKIVEIIDRYDLVCVPRTYSHRPTQFIQDDQTDKTCRRRYIVPKQMKSPVYIYYQLENFYQNHRRYITSRSENQLRSKSRESDVGTCDPEKNVNGEPIVPCGLVAWSLFNDSYSFSIGSKALEVNRKNIAWKSDREHKFGSDVYPKNFQTGGIIGGGKLNSSIPLSEQEDLIVWMRTAAFPTFRKLYGRIETDIQANEVIEVEIQNNYNTYGFDGKKSLILSTTSWVGGKNNFLGVAYLTLGGLCFFLTILFTLIYIFKPRRIGDPAFLSWNKNPGQYGS
ncbi:hypothetical protein K2173_024135 [Erythroxylum novogranatense]|uniref:ALA-interacting subunit n=1 Tax=Erythroxylum novogranatense TaxID=1862640 RepID=A0AAV8UC91_9ROSI|nr:hypothetical protein K2173_024135 [Erythroxylum novogranatense]